MHGPMALQAKPLISTGLTPLIFKILFVTSQKSPHQSSFGRCSAQPGWGTNILWGL